MHSCAAPAGLAVLSMQIGCGWLEVRSEFISGYERMLWRMEAVDGFCDDRLLTVT